MAANFFGAYSFRSDVRKNGSTDNILPGCQYHHWIIGCDLDQKIQTYAWTAGATQKQWMFGYIVGESSFYDNRILLADGALGAWVERNVKNDLAVPITGIVQFMDNTWASNYGNKKRYSYFNPLSKAYAQQYNPVHCLPNGDIQVYRSGANGHFYLIGETE